MATHTLDFERPLLELERQIEELKRVAGEGAVDVAKELQPLEQKLAELRVQIYRSLTPMQRVQVARHPKRPYALDYLRSVFSDFVELHGDRLFRDDPAIVGGWARLDGQTVMAIGHQKGRDTKENLRRNFGMAHPEGYRKALRLMKLAEKFHAPVVTLVDTPGAYPGIGAEERGQAEAIAHNLLEMAGLRTPILTAIIGEGGSGGALGVGLGDRVLMLENAVYSVISPEGCAAILWKDASQRERAAEALKITAQDLLQLGVIDEIVPEPPGGAHADRQPQGRATRGPRRHPSGGASPHGRGARRAGGGGAAPRPRPRDEGVGRRVAVGPPQAHDLLHGGAARGLPGARAGPGESVPRAHRAAPDRRAGRGEAAGRRGSLRSPVLLLELAPGAPAREPVSRQGPAPLAQPLADLRGVRAAAVLSPLRARLLRAGAEAVPQGGQGGAHGSRARARAGR